MPKNWKWQQVLLNKAMHSIRKWHGNTSELQIVAKSIDRTEQHASTIIDANFPKYRMINTQKAIPRWHASNGSCLSEEFVWLKTLSLAAIDNAGKTGKRPTHHAVGQLFDQGRKMSFSANCCQAKCR